MPPTAVQRCRRESAAQRSVAGTARLRDDRALGRTDGHQRGEPMAIRVESPMTVDTGAPRSSTPFARSSASVAERSIRRHPAPPTAAAPYCASLGTAGPVGTLAGGLGFGCVGVGRCSPGEIPSAARTRKRLIPSDSARRTIPARSASRARLIGMGGTPRHYPVAAARHAWGGQQSARGTAE